MRIFIFEKFAHFEISPKLGSNAQLFIKKIRRSKSQYNSVTKSHFEYASKIGANADLQYLPAENFFNITIAHFFLNFSKPAEMPIVVH